MEIRRGIAVSPGVAIGPALVIDTEGIRIPHRLVPAEHIPDEIKRLREGLSEAATDARETRQRITARLGPALGNIFGAQSSVFEDHILRSRIENAIRTECYSAEYAVSRILRELVGSLEDAGR